MPAVLDRRTFLKRASGAAAIAPFAAHWSLTGTDSEVRMALLSDTHISKNAFDVYRGFSPHQNLSRVMDQVMAKQPDLLLVNGDLARQTGEVLDYLEFNSFIQPFAERVPVALTLGNHDQRSNFRSAFFKHAGTQQPVAFKQVTTIDAGGVHFVMLDSLMTTNIAQGELGEPQRRWLAAHLDSQNDKPVIVFVHHNPGADALLDTDLLLSALKPRPFVKALFYGHRHIYRFDQADGLHLINLPAVGYNFEDGNPVGWVDATFSPTGANLTLHAVAGDTRGSGQSTRLDWR